MTGGHHGAVINVWDNCISNLKQNEQKVCLITLHVNNAYIHVL